MTPKRTPVAVTLGGLLVGVAVLAGCGTQQADSSASATSGASPSAIAPSAVTPTPSADAFVASVMRTRDLATADLEVTVTTDVGGNVRTLTGEGSSAVSNGYGDMRVDGCVGCRHPGAVQRQGTLRPDGRPLGHVDPAAR